MDCLFCRIAQGQEDTELLYEDEKFAAFRDIKPAAPFHVLIVPKEHIATLKDARAEHVQLLGELLLTAQKVVAGSGLEGYKVQINVGRAGGQVVDHLHLHVLGNTSP